MTVKSKIKDALKTGKLVIGTKKVKDGLKNGKIKYVIYATNCTPDILADLKYYAKYFNIKLEPFEGNSKQLGEACGKPFTILMVGIRE
jgi:large subunit ribosomal protein L30e